MHYESPVREPLVIGDKTYHDITRDVARPIETTAPKIKVRHISKVANIINNSCPVFVMHSIII